jgi:uncharacterized membrane protein YccC
VRLWPERPRRAAARAALHEAALNLRSISIIAGLRAATACAVPVVVAELLDRPVITWMSVAAFWACLADNGGPFRTRLSAMGGVTLLGAIGSVVAALIAGTDMLVLAVLYAGLVAFAGSFARIFGNAATSVGLLVTTSVLVSLGMPPMPPAEVPLFGALFFAGGLWAMVLTLLIWRLHPYQPARAAIALSYEALADLARGIAETHHHPGRDHASWDTLSLRRRRPSREAIEAARGILADLRRGRLGESGRGEGLILLLESADQIFLGLIGLSELLERRVVSPEQEATPDTIEHAVDLLAPALHVVAALLLGRGGATDLRLDGVVADLEAVRAGRQPELSGQPTTLVPQTAELLASLARLVHAAHDIAREVRAGQPLAALIRRAAESGNEAARVALSAPPRARERERLAALRSLILANLTWRSIAFRHGVRVALTAALGVWLTQEFDLQRGYWLTVTAVVILQPYYATTWQRALERVAGSVLGGLFAAGIGIVLTSPLAIALAIFPLAAAALAFRTVNYGLFTFLLTPQFVLIAELAQPGGGDLALAGLRALNSIAGGALALVAGALLWPTRERRHLPEHLAASLAAAADYLAAVLSLASGSDVPAAKIEESRRRAGLASNNAEGSLDRLLSEPGKRSRDAEPAMAIVTCVRRIAGAVTSLWVTPALGERCRSVPELITFAEWVRAALQGLAVAVGARAAPAALPPPPPIRVGEGTESEQHLRDALLRIARQISILHGAVRRLAASADDS